LTSREALKALCELVTVDPAFWAEITQPRSRGSEPLHLPPTLTPQQEESEDLEASALDIHGDDSEVPMSDVISASTQHPDTMGCNDDKLYVAGEGGGLVSTADAECTFMESVNGEIVDATQGGQAVEGRGRRKKRANTLYSSKFWVANGCSDEE
jgi:hypothetical protein